MAAPKNMSDGQMLCERKIYSLAWQLGIVVVHQMKKHEEEVQETLCDFTSSAPVLQKLQRKHSHANTFNSIQSQGTKYECKRLNLKPNFPKSPTAQLDVCIYLPPPPPNPSVSDQSAPLCRKAQGYVCSVGLSVGKILIQETPQLFDMVISMGNEDRLKM